MEIRRKDYRNIAPAGRRSSIYAFASPSVLAVRDISAEFHRVAQKIEMERNWRMAKIASLATKLLLTSL